MSKNIVEYDASQHPVDSVTVYQTNRAEIKRRVSVELQTGQNEVEIVNLPTKLEENSIRVDGVGRGATIFDVIYHSRDLPDSRDQDKLLAPLNKRRDALKAQREVLERQSRIMKDYSKTLTGTNCNTDNLVTFLDTFSSKQEAIEAKLVAVDDELAEVNAEIKDLRDKINDERYVEVMRRACVTIVLHAEEAGSVDLSLTYMVSNAAWTPLYDIRATLAENSKENAAVHLNYRASIYQGTGEDWTDVALVLSTASPQQDSITIPNVQPQWIGERGASVVYSKPKSATWVTPTTLHAMAPPAIIQPPAQGPAPVIIQHPPTYMVSRSASYSSSRRSRSSSPVAMMARGPGGYFGTPEVPTGPPPGFMPTRDVVASGSSGSTSFTIPGLSTIPSATAKKSQTHKVSIADIECGSMELSWVAVPRDNTNAYIQCKVKNTSDFLLLQGQANVFMNNSFVAKSSIPRVSPQESFTCSLGVDSAVNIIYHPLKTKAKTSGTSIMIVNNKTNIHTYEQIITVKNMRLSALSPIIIKDRVPVSRDAKIKVTVLEPRGLQSANSEKVTSPQSVQVGKGVYARWARRADDNFRDGEPGGEGDAGFGRMGWVCDVAAGASVDLTLAWEVNAPAGVQLEFQ